MTSRSADAVPVFLLDDHEIVRKGIRDLLEATGEFAVVGEAGTAADALWRLPLVSPRVAILDVRLPDGNGVEVCRELRSRHPELRCLMLTAFSDDDALVDSVMAGAAGYVLKQIRGSDLIGAVRRVAAGESLIDPATARRVMALLAEPEDAELEGLTPQERRILDLIGEGLTNRQIGERMFLAEKTVKNYVSNLLRKLGLSRRTEAAALVVRTQERRRRSYEIS